MSNESSIKESDLSEIDKVSTKLPGKLPLVMSAIRQQAIMRKEISEMLGSLSPEERLALRKVLQTHPAIRKVAIASGIAPMRFRLPRRNRRKFNTRLVEVHTLSPTTIHAVATVVSGEKENDADFPETLSTRTVSKILGVSPQMVRRYCQDGKLKATRTLGLAGDWHIDTQDLLLMDSQYADKLRDLLEERATRNQKLVQAVEKMAERPGVQKILDGIDQRREEADRRRELND